MENFTISNDGVRYLDNTQEEESFEELAKKLMKYLAQNYHPQAKIIISCTEAEIVEGTKGFGTYEFVD